MQPQRTFFIALSSPCRKVCFFFSSSQFMLCISVYRATLLIFFQIFVSDRRALNELAAIVPEHVRVPPTCMEAMTS